MEQNFRGVEPVQGETIEHDPCIHVRGASGVGV